MSDETARARTYAAPPKAAASMHAYLSDWHNFQAWCEEREIDALPAQPDTLTRYVTGLADTARKVSTIRPSKVTITSSRAPRLRAARHRG